MPPKAKKQSVNQHDKRHDNGSVAPGKRVVKEKVNGNINGHANTSPQTPPPPAEILESQAQHISLPRNFDNETGGIQRDGKMSFIRTFEEAEQERRASETSSNDASVSHGTPSSEHVAQQPARGDDVSNMRTTGLPGTGALTFASTILSSCPLRDVLAILIILIQLPPTVLTVIECLFALLTFVPPTTGLSLSSAFNINGSFAELFQNFGVLAGYSGAPSLGVTILVDGVVLFLWLFVPNWAQPFFLDMSQAVIAVSLGGGFHSRGGSTWNIIYGFSIILMMQLFRYRHLRHWRLGLFSPWVSDTHFGSFSMSTPKAKLSNHPVSGVPWWNALLIVHILVQYCMRQARRALSRKGQKSDPEAAAASQPPLSTNLAADTPNDSESRSTSTDGRHPGPPPSHRENRDKSISNRQKKKQATQVRSQQPFWAALASTKVHVLKEMEQKQARIIAMEARAADSERIDCAAMDREEEVIWISEISSTGVRFGITARADIDEQKEEEGEDRSSGLRKMRPVYLRINGADWSSARISRVQSLSKESLLSWEGDIFGLTALSNYTCDFVRTSDDAVVFSTSLITQPSSSSELDSICTPSTQRPLIPSSPTTTLKNSVAAAESKLDQQRARAKRVKKDHRASLAVLKKEVDSLHSRLSSSGGNDEKQRQRVLQMNQHIRQAEDAVASIESQIAALKDIPDSEISAADTKEASWRKERDRLDTVRTETSSRKLEADRQISAVQTEISNTSQKRDRLVARRERLNEQFEFLATANAKAVERKAKRKHERAAELASREFKEQQFVAGITHYEHQAEEYRVKTAGAWQSIYFLENNLNSQHQAQQQQATNAIPTTPEGIIPGTGLNNRFRNNLPFPGFQFPQLSDSTRTAPNLRGGRGRSSSMLSNVSGFTDDLDGLAPVQKFNPNATSFAVNQKRDSDGSMSAAESGSSSQKDQLSPVPKVVSPLKTELGRDLPTDSR